MKKKTHVRITVTDASHGVVSLRINVKMRDEDMTEQDVTLTTSDSVRVDLESDITIRDLTHHMDMQRN